MGKVPLSLHVKAQLKKELEQEAHLLKISESELAERAIQSYLDNQVLKREAIRKAIVEADKGVFISAEAMHRWLGQLDEDINAEPPKPDIFLRRRHKGAMTTPDQGSR